MKRLAVCEEEVFVSLFEMDEDMRCLNPVLEYVNKKYGHAWKPQTVSTFLKRLEKKGYTTMKRTGRVVQHIPTITLQEYQMQKLREMKNLLFGGDFEEIKKCLEVVIDDGQEREV